MAKIVGYRYQEGIGKTSGKPYSAVLVSYIEPFEAGRGNGYEAGEMFVNRADWDAATVGNSEKDLMNRDFTYAYDRNGFLKHFALAPAAQKA